MAANIKATSNAKNVNNPVVQNERSIPNQGDAAQQTLAQVERASISNNPDPQVKATRRYSPRRYYNKAYKLGMLSAYDACTTASERGELLRKEGLYHSRIGDWRRELEAGTLKGKKRQKKHQPRIDHLVRENEQLKKKLAQAEAIIDLQKKVSELLGTHILPHEKNEA